MWLSLMKGGASSTRTNGLRTEGSSAALHTSIRHAAVAGQPLRFNNGQLPGKLQSVPFKEKLSPPLIKISPLTRFSRLLQLRAHCSSRVIFWKLSAAAGCLWVSDSPHLERLKPARPECDASSISGVTMRSIMSVSTVKVGTTIKSMNPGVTDGKKFISIRNDLTAAALNSDNSNLYLVPLLWSHGYKTSGFALAGDTKSGRCFSWKLWKFSTSSQGTLWSRLSTEKELSDLGDLKFESMRQVRQVLKRGSGGAGWGGGEGGDWHVIAAPKRANVSEI